jgi:ribosome biogenesis protein ERB1
MKDLYLTPRFKRRKVLDEKKADDLLPELPDPEELRPFPEIQSLIYEGHEHIIRNISIDPNGKFLASGSGKIINFNIDDYTIRIFEITTGRCLKIYKFNDIIQSLEWNPNPNLNILLCSIKESVYIIVPEETFINDEVKDNTLKLFPGDNETENLEHSIESVSKKKRKKILLKWLFFTKNNDLMEDNFSHYRKMGIQSLTINRNNGKINTFKLCNTS